MYWPELRLREGDELLVDGYSIKIVQRKSNETFRVEANGGHETWHIDDFSELTHDADVVWVYRNKRF